MKSCVEADTVTLGDDHFRFTEKHKHCILAEFIITTALAKVDILFQVTFDNISYEPQNEFE